jgi:hypothetical protein
MSVLPPEVHTALTQLLTGLQSPDNVLRTQAEEQLTTEWVQGRPDILLMALVEQIIGADEVGVSSPSQASHPHIVQTGMFLGMKGSLTALLPQTRSFAAVLFRRVSSKVRKDPGSELQKETFLTIPQPQRNAIREKLLQALTTEAMAVVRNKVSDAIAELARQYTEDGKF